MRAPVPRLHLHLRLEGARVAVVRFGGMPPPEAAAALEGTSAAAAVNLAPLLFGAHPAAQSCAALTACEQALGLVPSRDQLAARRLMLAAEILHEHLAQLTLEWPRRLHERVQPLGLGVWRAHLHALHDAVTPPEEWRRLHGAPPLIDTAALHRHLDALEAQLARTLYGLPGDEWLALEGYGALKRWALTTDTPLARTIDAIVDFGLQGLGASRVEPLVETGAEALAAMMEQRWFALRPSWEGEPRESGPLARQRRNPLVGALRERFGNGLLTRLVARMVETPLLLRGLRHLFTPGRELALQPAVEGALLTPGDGRGLAVVEAAPGRLVHQVALEGERVIRYRILAAERWNLHPEGALARGLAGLDASDPPRLRRDVELTLASLLPHLPHDLVLENLLRASLPVP